MISRSCSACRHWQKNALGKLEAREKLKAGTVVLKLKVAKNLRPMCKENIPTSVEVPSDADGAQLAEAVGKLVNVEAASLKLISGGKVLKEEGTVCGDLGCLFKFDNLDNLKKKNRLYLLCTRYTCKTYD